MTFFIYKKAHIATLFVTVVLFSTISGCNNAPVLSEEEKIRATLNAIELAAEERSVAGVVNHLSESYHDFSGNDLKKIQRFIQFQIFKNQNINIFSKINELDVVGNSATVELSVATASHKADLSSESNRLRANVHRVSVQMRKEENQWLIHRISWQRGW